MCWWSFLREAQNIVEVKDVVVGPCGEKVGHASAIVEEELEAGGEKLEGVYIRWLIGRNDNAKVFALRIVRMEPGSHIPAHAHPWEHEQYILRGEGVFRIGSRKYRVRPGMFLYIPPNVEHEYWNTGSEDLVFICIVPLKPSAPEEKLNC